MKYYKNLIIREKFEPHYEYMVDKLCFVCPDFDTFNFAYVDRLYKPKLITNIFCI